MQLIGKNLDYSRYPAPPVLPPKEHPRLLFRGADVVRLRENSAAPQNKDAMEALKALLRLDVEDSLPVPQKGAANFDEIRLSAIEALGFDWVLRGNADSGRKAVRGITEFLKTCVYDGLPDNCRHMGHTIFTASEIFDWCHSLLTEKEKRELIALCEETAVGMEIGYPPDRQGAVCGHGGEAQLMRNLLSFSIAVYDERPDIYRFCAGRFFDEFLPPRNDWCQTHSHHQGIAYGSYRYGWDLWAAWIFKRMAGIEVYSADMGSVPYEWIYSRRPDGQMLRNGDDFMEYKEPFPYWTGFMAPLFYAANYYGDPYLKGEFQREMALVKHFPLDNGTLSPVQFLIFNDPALEGKPLSSLPKTKYFKSPYGAMITRTGWEMGSDDTLIFMKIGERWGANHNHLDSGHFQIYKNGILASDSGYYGRYGDPHDGNYNKRSVAHNTLLIYDPEETPKGYPPYLNDGGQRFPEGGKEPENNSEWMSGEYQTGKVLSHTQSQEFCSLSGDITPAYGEKAQKVRRFMAFFPGTDKESPDIFMVFDQVVSLKAEFQKTFLLHTQQEPFLSGTRIEIQNGAGRMTMECLLPLNPVIRAVGGEGKAFWTDHQNLMPETPPPPSVEAGWGRIEVTPRKQEKEACFLHLFTLGGTKTTARVREEKDFYLMTSPSLTAVWTKDSQKPPKSLALFGLPKQRLFLAGLENGNWLLNGTKTVMVTEQVLFLGTPPQDLILQREHPPDAENVEALPK